MPKLGALALSVCFLWPAVLLPAALPSPVHVWEKAEIVLQAQRAHENPYVDVTVWVDLEGPDFHKRVYGFWDGDRTFRVRVAATAPGKWSWTSGANVDDPGLRGSQGSFDAVPWSEREREENLCRRGFLRPTANGHAFEHPDGTPFLMLADTWWAAGSFHYRWTEDDASHAMGSQATFKDLVKFRKAQGYNGIAMLAAFPSWANDGKPARYEMADKTLVRGAWAHPGTGSAKDMHNGGGRPFLFPGRIPGLEDTLPDLDRINPAYFRELDQKIDYLNSQGFIPFLEAARRDTGQVWRKFYPWPDSYARYVQYVWSRYQANNVLFSPIHYDWHIDSLPAAEYSKAAMAVIRKYGRPPFGTLVSANSYLSTLVDFGAGEDASWITFHQTANERTHDAYWFMTELFHSTPALPAIAGEPYYAGLHYNPGREVPYAAKGGTEKDSLYNRSALYGNFLSGGLGGYIYGADGIWQANTEPEAAVKMWDAFQWESGAQVKHLHTFALSEGKRYQELEPQADLLSPNKSHQILGYEGWSFCARTPRRDFFLIFLEKGCPRVLLRGAAPEKRYVARWFNPRSGEWSAVGSGALDSDFLGRIQLPEPPGGDDWGLSLVLAQDRRP
jgi:hypothetical protein